MNDSFINNGTEIINRENQDLTKMTESVKLDIPKYWERDYINARLNDIQNGQHRMLFFLLWRSGIRITEALSIKKSDLDFQNYIMTVRWLKSRKYLVRKVPMHPTLKEVLQAYVGSLKADDKLFPFTRQRAWQLSKQYFEGSPHQFRHSFAVNWLRCGCDIFILSRILGHSDIRTTQEYLKIVPIEQGKELLKVEF